MYQQESAAFSGKTLNEIVQSDAHLLLMSIAHSNSNCGGFENRIYLGEIQEMFGLMGFQKDQVNEMICDLLYYNIIKKFSGKGMKKSTSFFEMHDSSQWKTFPFKKYDMLIFRMSSDTRKDMNICISNTRKNLRLYNEPLRISISKIGTLYHNIENGFFADQVEKSAIFETRQGKKFLEYSSQFINEILCLLDLVKENTSFNVFINKMIDGLSQILSYMVNYLLANNKNAYPPSKLLNDLLSILIGIEEMGYPHYIEEQFMNKYLMDKLCYNGPIPFRTKALSEFRYQNTIGFDMMAEIIL